MIEWQHIMKNQFPYQYFRETTVFFPSSWKADQILWWLNEHEGEGRYFYKTELAVSLADQRKAKATT